LTLVEYVFEIEDYDKYLQEVNSVDCITHRQQALPPIPTTSTSSMSSAPRKESRQPPYSDSHTGGGGGGGGGGVNRPSSQRTSSDESQQHSPSLRQNKNDGTGLKETGPSINMDNMKKGITSLWKTVKATANTVIEKTSASLSSSSSSSTYSSPLSKLTELVSTDFDFQNPFHVHLLQELWNLQIQPLVNESFPSQDVSDGSFSSIHWKLTGWQNINPVKDLKTTGLLALQSANYFGNHYHEENHRILSENRSNIKTNYPVAIVIVNLTLLLIEMFSLRDHK
jgi:hypothetical protein